MCDTGSTWGLTIKTQPSSEVLFTDQHAVTSHTRAHLWCDPPPSLVSKSKQLLNQHGNAEIMIFFMLKHNNLLWDKRNIFTKSKLIHSSQCFGFRAKDLKNSLSIKTASCYYELWTTLKRLSSRSTKATNGSWKCDTTEKNSFDSVLMDILVSDYTPWEQLYSIVYAHNGAHRHSLALSLSLCLSLSLSHTHRNILSFKIWNMIYQIQIGFHSWRDLDLCVCALSERGTNAVCVCVWHVRERESVRELNKADWGVNIIIAHFLPWNKALFPLLPSRWEYHNPRLKRMG